MKVTAVYVGWRGARINERAMHRFGVIGAWLGAVASFPTLFDRKPVSEQIAPAVMSALRSIDRALSRNDVNGKPKADARENRMIVFGHSLGGNMLATGLQDSAIKAVRNHQPGEVMPPLIGNLAVLINPASEASKWTSIQREVWRRIMFHTSEVTPFDKVLASHKFFRIEQRPVLISVTSAFGFPPGRLRDGDCTVMEAMKMTNVLSKIENRQDQFDQTGVYDWATRELFPAFKGDLRPLAQRVDLWRAWIEGLPIPGTDCRSTQQPYLFRWTLALPARGLSAFLSTFPFQNRNNGTMKRRARSAIWIHRDRVLIFSPTITSLGRRSGPRTHCFQRSSDNASSTTPTPLFPMPP